MLGKLLIHSDIGIKVTGLNLSKWPLILVIRQKFRSPRMTGCPFISNAGKFHCLVVRNFFNFYEYQTKRTKPEAEKSGTGWYMYRIIFWILCLLEYGSPKCFKRKGETSVESGHCLAHPSGDLSSSFGSTRKHWKSHCIFRRECETIETSLVFKTGKKAFYTDHGRLTRRDDPVFCLLVVFWFTFTFFPTSTQNTC